MIRQMTRQVLQTTQNLYSWYDFSKFQSQNTHEYFNIYFKHKNFHLVKYVIDK